VRAGRAGTHPAEDRPTTLLTRLAAHTAQILNLAAASQAAGLKARTAENHTRLLEALFLIHRLHRLPAWGPTLHARAVAMPTPQVVDSGMAARLVRLTLDKLNRPEPTATAVRPSLGDIRRRRGAHATVMTPTELLPSAIGEPTMAPRSTSS
jgi:predicted AAA+ superfamily ATPase